MSSLKNELLFSSLSKCYFSSNESELQTIYVHFVEPLILLVIILASIILNMALWFHMQYMSFQAWRQARKNSISTNSSSSNSGSGGSGNVGVTGVLVPSSGYANRRQRVVRLSTRRATATQNSFNLVLIVSNLNDLPYVFWFALFLLKKVASQGLILNTFDIMFILAHSLNFIIYFLFHSEFRSSTFEMARNVNSDIFYLMFKLITFKLFFL